MSRERGKGEGEERGRDVREREGKDRNRESREREGEENRREGCRMGGTEGGNQRDTEIMVSQRKGMHVPSAVRCCVKCRPLMSTGPIKGREAVSGPAVVHYRSEEQYLPKIVRSCQRCKGPAGATGKEARTSTPKVCKALASQGIFTPVLPSIRNYPFSTQCRIVNPYPCTVD